MPFYEVTLVNYLPPPRFDGVSWSRVRIEESPGDEFGPAGPVQIWTELETVPLDPIDSDPTHPVRRSVSTDLATLPRAWYRPVFLDEVNTEAPGEPLYSDEQRPPPTTGEARQRSRLLRSMFPEESNDPVLEEDLRQIIQDSTSMVQAITCRTMDATLPADLVEVAYRAIIVKAEQLAVQGDVQIAKAVAGGKRLRSISAGPWSESYFGPGELVTKSGRPMMDPNPLIDEALWALTTEECRDAFVARATGLQPPAGAVTAFDYRRMGSGWPLRGGLGPDGF